MRTIAIFLMLCGSASAQCYSRASYGCGYPVATYTYPTYTTTYPTYNTSHTYPNYDNSLNVQYNITFPPPAITGSTQYGYIPQNYFHFDPMEAYKLRIGLSERAIGLAESANASASLIVQAAGASDERMFKLMFADKLKALFETPITPGTTYEFKAIQASSGAKLVDPSGSHNLSSPAGTPGEALGAAAIFKSHCVTCHGAAKKEGGLDLSDLTTLTPAVGLKILDRITTNNPSLRMPKGGSLTARQIFSLHNDFIAASTPNNAPAPGGAKQ